MPSPITITLSPELSEQVRARAASEGYSSEGEYIEEHLAEVVSLDPELENWLRTTGVARYDAYNADPKNTFTEEEVLGYVQDHLNPLRKTG